MLCEIEEDEEEAPRFRVTVNPGSSTSSAEEMVSVGGSMEEVWVDALCMIGGINKDAVFQAVDVEAGVVVRVVTAPSQKLYMQDQVGTVLRKNAQGWWEVSLSLDAAAMDFGLVSDHQGGADREYWWWLEEKLADTGMSVDDLEQPALERHINDLLTMQAGARWKSRHRELQQLREGLYAELYAEKEARAVERISSAGGKGGKSGGGVGKALRGMVSGFAKLGAAASPRSRLTAASAAARH